jgi:hypothetical protein
VVTRIDRLARSIADLQDIVARTLKITPAMAAGVTSRLWEMDDIVDVLETWEAAHQRHVVAA